MADYILLESADKQNQVRVVVHTAVPNSNNAVGVKWRDAVVGWVGSRSDPVGEMTSVVPVSMLPAGVQADLDTGAVYEWEGTVRFDANISNAAKLTEIETWVSDRDATEFARLQSILEFYGKTGTV